MVPHQIYGVPTTKLPVPHKEYGVPNRPHKSNAGIKSKLNFQKTFFPIVETTSSSNGVTVPHQVYGVPNNGLVKPKTKFSESHEEGSTPKTFYPIFESESSEGVTVPHQEYGVPNTKPPLHKEYDFPNKEYDKAHTHKETSTPKRFLPIFETATSSNSVAKPHQTYDLPHSQTNQPNIRNDIKVAASSNIYKKNLLKKYLNSKTLTSSLELVINSEEIEEILKPIHELVLPNAESSESQEQVNSQSTPLKPHETYGVPTASPTKPHEFPSQKPQKPHQVYGIPEMKPPKIFGGKDENIGKVPVLKFKYVPYIEYVDFSNYKKIFSAPKNVASESNLDYW